MCDELSSRVDYAVGLLHDYCADAENESLPAPARLEAARSVVAVSPWLLSTPALRGRIGGGLRERMDRVSWLARALETH